MIDDARGAGRRSRWPPELWLLLALAAAVRFWGLGFGMPHVWARPDELVVTDVAQGFLRGDLNPRFWDYPTLFMYLVAALDYAYYLVGRTAGWFRSLPHFLSLWRVQWTAFFMIARATSAVAGTLTVAATYWLGTRLFDRLTAFVGGLFLALAFLHVRDSHFGVTDVTMGLCVMLSTAWLVRGALQDRAGFFAAAGAFAGAGASIKYNAVVMAVPLVAALFVSTGVRWRETVRRALWFAACFVASFVAGSPFSVIEPASFMRGLLGQSAHVSVPHGVDLGRGGVYHLAFSLRYGLGIPLLAAGIGGFVWLFRRDWRRAMLLTAFPLAYYALLFPTRTVFVRYAIPLVPFLCVGAAYTTVETARMLARRTSVSAAAAALFLSALIVAPSAYAVGQIDRLFRATDTRLLLADWIRANVKPGSTIYLAGSVVVEPIVDVGSVKTLRYWTHVKASTFAENRVPVSGLPDWIVIPETGVPEYSYCPPEVKALVREAYDPVRVFVAMNLQGNYFDRQDAFYYPYAGFHDAARGGPNYTVYARKPAVTP